MTEQAIKKDWFRILSPAIFGAGLSVVGIIISFIKCAKSDCGWDVLGIPMFAQVFVALLALDFLLKLVFKYKTLTVWLIELFVLVIVRWILGF